MLSPSRPRLSSSGGDALFVTSLPDAPGIADDPTAFGMVCGEALPQPEDDGSWDDEWTLPLSVVEDSTLREAALEVGADETDALAGGVDAEIESVDFEPASLNTPGLDLAELEPDHAANPALSTSDDADPTVADPADGGGVMCARLSAIDLLAWQWEEQDPRFLRQALWFTARVAPEVRPQFLTALFSMVSHHPRATCAVIAMLSRLSPKLDEAGLRALAKAGARALERVPFPLRVSLISGLLRAGRLAMAQALVLHELGRCPAPECTHWLMGLLTALPPSERRLLDLDGLISRCLDRLGTVPTLYSLEPLFRTVDLRQLRDDGLRTTLLLAWTRALKPELLHVRHRERLFFLARLTDHPVLRARLMVMHDLAHMTLVGSDVGIPQLVLSMLPHFPQILDDLPEDEAAQVVTFLLRRLFRRLNEQDHEQIVETLCSLQRPAPFLTAYFVHLTHIGNAASAQVKVEHWSAVFSAWLQRHMSPYREAAEIHLQEVARDLDRTTQRELRSQLKRRFGSSSQFLKLSGDGETRSSWLKPWFRGSRVTH